MSAPRASSAALTHRHPAPPTLGREGDYTSMAGYYDLIMQAGYYDYPAIGTALADLQARSVLEVGCGTGLILEQLVTRRPELELAGIDLTPAMLDIAAERLHAYPHITLQQRDVVTLDLGRSFDVAFSYGGPHYFVPGPDGLGFTMVSHISGDAANRLAFERLADHLAPGGLLLLGVQSPHADYTTPISAQMNYAQRITPNHGGFRKDYYLTDHGETVMRQTTDYQTSTFDESVRLLADCGFRLQTDSEGATSMFLTFVRR